jgi:coenzyme PQQ precursor peptide PqqA
MSTWKTPTIVEIPAGMEIGAYAPAEMDEPPHVAVVSAEANPARADAPVRRNVAAETASAS